MSAKKINPCFAVLLLLMIVVAAIRIPNAAQLTPWSKFTPIVAMGLFGGAYFTSKWKAFAFPLLTLLISDLIINLFVFEGKYGAMYCGWYVIYGVIALIVFYGKWVLQKVCVKNVLIASVVTVVSHWLIADFTVWIGGGTDLRTMTLLTKNLAGLGQYYVQGFPFVKNFLIGTLLYSGILFGGFELAKQRFPVLKLQFS